MSNGAAGAVAASAAGAAAAAMAQAIKASGAIVRVEARDFTAIVEKSSNPLVVCAQSWFFSRRYQYLTSYKGFIFYAKNETPLRLPNKAEIVQARKIWIPGD